MKHIILIVSLLMGVTLGVQAQPKALFDKTTHEFGTILWKNPVTATFKITNKGDKPLVISNVTTSCGCTVADWTKEPIAPGKTGIVSSTFDAKAIGRFQKSVGIYCNASNKPIYLAIRGEVTADPKNYTFTHPFQIGAIRLDKEEIEFEDANKGDKPTMELLVANTSDKLYTPVLMHLPPYLSAVATPEKLGRGRTGKIKITLDTDKLPKLGLTTASVYLSRFPGDKVGEENEIPVSAILLPDFSHISQQERLNPPAIHLSAKELQMGELKSDEKKAHTIIVKNVGKSNLEILDLQVFNSALGVQLKKRVLKPGAPTKLKSTAFGQNLKKVKHEQNYHFQVLSILLDKLGFEWGKGLVHFSYGMVELPEGKMKSREGTVVDADDLMEAMIETAKETSAELGKLDGLTQEEADNIARIVGLGALKYFILKVDARKNMTFNPKESIDFNGNTGPFIQYTYARIQSVLRKAAEAGIVIPEIIPAGLELSAKEEGLIQMLADFKSVVKQAGSDYNPSIIANYAYDLVKEYNQFFTFLCICTCTEVIVSTVNKE